MCSTCDKYIRSEWEEGDEIEISDLPFWDSRKPEQGMDVNKLDGNDHVTTWAENKKGKEFALYINTITGKQIVY